jgi:hypothetical protein
VVFGYPFPQIRRKQQEGVPVYIDKSCAHVLILPDSVLFGDPLKGEAQQAASRNGLNFYITRNYTMS